MTPYYLEKLNIGLKFQDYVCELLYESGIPIISYSSKEYQNNIGENKAGFEIKRDNNFRKTGNLYIEISEKSNSENMNFVLSGIYRNDNTWLYLIGDESEVFVLSKKQLKILYENKKYKEVYGTDSNGGKTSKGFLLPVSDARKIYSLKQLKPKIKDE